MHNTTKERCSEQSEVSLLVDRLIQRLQGALQAVLTDFQPVLTHIISPDLDQAV